MKGSKRNLNRGVLPSSMSYNHRTTPAPPGAVPHRGQPHNGNMYRQATIIPKNDLNLDSSNATSFHSSEDDGLTFTLPFGPGTVVAEEVEPSPVDGVAYPS